jgi:hypothetical protein
VFTANTAHWISRVFIEGGSSAIVILRPDLEFFGGVISRFFPEFCRHNSMMWLNFVEERQIQHSAGPGHSGQASSKRQVDV